MGHFLPFYSFQKPKKSEFWKSEKFCWRYHHFAHAYERRQSYEVRSLRYWVRQKEFFVSFFIIFCPFTPLKNQKINILKNERKDLEISSFYTCVPKILIIWCRLSEIRTATDIILCHSGPFFALLSHYWPRKLKFRKNVKKALELLSFYTYVP